MKVKVIPADLEKPMEFATVADDNKLYDMQRLLGSDCYVEMVRLGRYPITHQFNHKQTQTVPRDGSLYMVVDEDGIRKNLPVNHRASALYGTQYHGSPIVGDAVLLGQDYDDEGELDWVDYPLED